MPLSQVWHGLRGHVGLHPRFDLKVVVYHFSFLQQLTHFDLLSFFLE